VVQWVSAYPLPQSLQWRPASSRDVSAAAAATIGRSLAGNKHLSEDPDFRYIASSKSVTYGRSDMCGFPGACYRYRYRGYTRVLGVAG
jgi:hypothetical protein